MKTMTVEGLLSWAFNSELPKVGSGSAGPSGVSGSSWSLVYSMGELGALIDRSPNRWGVIADFSEQDQPHPDAVAIGEAVFGLDSSEIDVPNGWAPFPEWPDEAGLIAAGVAAALERWRLRAMASRCAHVRMKVITHAVLKTRPDWRAEEPKVRMVMRGDKPAWFIERETTDRFGRKYRHELDGFNRRTHRPFRGAYRKYVLSRDISGDVMARLDWQLWISALEAIAAEVAPRLTEHAVAPVRIARAPWRADAKEKI